MDISPLAFFGQLRNGLRPSRLFLCFLLLLPFLTFFFALFLGCFSCQEMGKRGTGDNSYYFVVNVMLYPDMMVFVVLFVLVSLNFVNA